MSRLTTITRPDCVEIRAAIVAALASVEKKFGLKLVMKTGKFSDGSFTVPVEFCTLGEGGIPQDQEALNFKEGSFLYGIPPEALGKTILVRGVPFILRGLKSRGVKLPFSAERVSDGKIFGLGILSVTLGVKSALDVGASQVAGKTPPVVPLKRGDSVKALWSDGVWYHATYLRAVDGKHSVQFEDGSRFRADKVMTPSKSTDPALM